MRARTALVFPAFVTEFMGCENRELASMGVDLQSYFNTAQDLTGIPLPSVLEVEGGNERDELQTQLISYLYSCAVSDAYRDMGRKADILAAYSMGIYAALYHGGCLSMEDGLSCVLLAYQSLKNCVETAPYSMAVIGGLEDHDITPLKDTIAPGTFRVNSNNRHTYVFSGPAEEIAALLEKAREEGALLTRMMPVRLPYHTPYLESGANQFLEVISNIPVKDSSVQIISSLDQRLLNSADDLRKEMYLNLFHSFNWYKSMQHMLDRGVKIFIECGGGDSLSKINKFIQGDYRTVNLKKLREFILTC